MLYQIFSIIIYFLILSFLGWQLTRVLLKENRREFLIPLSLSFGIFFYIFILNITSYFIDIKINFYLILILFLLIGLGIRFFKKNNKKTIWYFKKKWRFILLVTFFLIIIISGFSSAREIDIDEVSFGQLPLTATIAVGNFPVMNPSLPNQSMQYHYASELWRASIFEISGIKLWFIQDIQVAIANGLFFFLSFILIFYITKKKLFSYIIALVSLFGGGLNSFFGFEGIFNYLYKNGNFAFVADMIHGEIHITGSAIQSISLSWATVAFPVVILILYLYFKLLDSKEWINLSILISILLCVLALSAETFFVIIIFSLLIFCRKLKSLLFIITITLFIVVFQGGVLTETFHRLFNGSQDAIFYDFFISINPFIMDIGEKISIFSHHFILNWGLLLFLIIPALIYFRKNKYIMFLGLISIVSFTIPFVIHIKELSWEIRRVLFLVPPLWGIIVSLFLLKIIKIKKILIILFIFLCFDSFVFLVAHSINPYYRPDHNNSFWGEPLQSIAIEEYSWIKLNTTIDDYFLTFSRKTNFPNRDFILYTGRFAPIFQEFHTENFYFLETLLYQKVENNCDNKALKELDFDYIYVNEYWEDGLEKKCLNNNNLELKFDNSDNDRISRIYLIKN